MGILNVTPDSFSDGGIWWRDGAPEARAAAEYGVQMARDGAAAVDVGPEATSFHRPGIAPVAAAEQIARAIPVIRAMARMAGAPRTISIDTRSSAVAQAALDAGATMINDVSAGLTDSQMLKTAARANCQIILMDGQFETPGVLAPRRANVLKEVCDFLTTRAAAAMDAGVRRENILLDPGIGFGKRSEDSWVLLHELRTLEHLGFPLVLGVSRKRFLMRGSDSPNYGPGSINSHEAPWPDDRNHNEDSLSVRDMLTATTMMLCFNHGVAFHRVHNVAYCADAIRAQGDKLRKQK